MKNLFFVAAVGLGALSAIGADIEFRYNTYLQHSDNGHLSTEGKDATKSASISALTEFDVKGKTDDDVSYEATIMNHMVLGHVEKGLGMFSLAVGNKNHNFGGYDKKYFLNPIALSTYADQHVPAVGSYMTVGADLGGMGSVSLQLVEDKVYSTAETVTLQPATFIQYHGDFGVVKPLVQLGFYDTAHSNFLAVGFEFATAGVTGFFDYVMDSRMNPKVGEEDRKANEMSSMVLDVAYNAGTLVPYFRYASFDTTQPGTDLKGNSDAVAKDDNAQEMTLGAKINCFGSAMVPEIAYVSKSQKVGADAESKTEGALVVGVSGAI